MLNTAAKGGTKQIRRLSDRDSPTVAALIWSSWSSVDTASVTACRTDESASVQISANSSRARAPSGRHTSFLPEVFEDFGRREPIRGLFTPSEFLFVHLGGQRDVGGDIDLRNKSSDDSPLFVAEFDRFGQCVQLFLKLGVDRNRAMFAS